MPSRVEKCMRSDGVPMPLREIAICLKSPIEVVFRALTIKQAEGAVRPTGKGWVLNA